MPTIYKAILTTLALCSIAASTVMKPPSSHARKSRLVLQSANPAKSLFSLKAITASKCDAGEKVCGDYCILSSYTCCPDQQGGCPSSDYCSIGDNGSYGCCPNGETCTGDGGSDGATCEESGYQTCGTNCIPAGASCCADFSGYCDSGETCVADSTGIYGCCDDGDTACLAGTSGSSGSCEDAGLVTCGANCAHTAEACCPDKSGSCDAGEYCGLADNGVYGCCPTGETCTGDAPTSSGLLDGGSTFTFLSSTASGLLGGGGLTGLTSTTSTSTRSTTATTTMNSSTIDLSTMSSTPNNPFTSTTTRTTFPSGPSTTASTTLAGAMSGATAHAVWQAGALGPIVAALLL